MTSDGPSDVRPTGAPRVALLGPVPPFRSGIADQTVRLARALAAIGVPPLVVTFRRLYPRALYPGASDRSEGAGPDDLDVRPVLDGWNPATFSRAARLVAAARADVAILPWWTAFFGPHDLVLLGSLKRRAPRTTTLLYAHNLADHERRGWKDLLARAVFRRADRILVQNRAAEASVRAALPGKPVTFVAHPSEPRPSPPSRADARGALDLPAGALVFLFTGLLREYKGWDLALEAFAGVRAERPDAILVLAGEPWGDARALAARPAPEGVRLELGFLSEERRALHFAAADAVLCPYRRATGSGIAADAIAFGRPVIGTRVDGLVDVLEDGRSALLVPPGDAPALKEAMLRFAREGLGGVLAEGAAAARAAHAPEAHARAVLRAAGWDAPAPRHDW